MGKKWCRSQEITVGIQWVGRQIPIISSRSGIDAFTLGLLHVHFLWNEKYNVLSAWYLTVRAADPREPSTFNDQLLLPLELEILNRRPGDPQQRRHAQMTHSRTYTVQVSKNYDQQWESLH